MKIKKGDTVEILSGKDRGKRGKVLGVFPAEGRALLEGINVKKRHERPRRAGRKGSIIAMPAPIAVSVVELVCPHCGKPTRVGYRRDDAGKKVRWCKRCKATIP